MISHKIADNIDARNTYTPIAVVVFILSFYKTTMTFSFLVVMILSLGLGHNRYQNKPQTLMQGIAIRQIACGDDHTIILQDDNDVLRFRAPIAKVN